MAIRPTPQSPQAHLRQMNVLHLAMLGGQLMLFTLLFFMFDTAAENVENSSSIAGGFDITVVAMICLFISAVGISIFLFNKRKVEGQNLNGSLMEKLNHYRSSFIMRIALLEGANLTMLIFYFFVTKNIVFLVLFGLGVLLFLIARPTAKRVIEDYQLSNVEQSQLRPSLL